MDIKPLLYRYLGDDGLYRSRRNGGWLRWALAGRLMFCSACMQKPLFNVHIPSIVSLHLEGHDLVGWAVCSGAKTKHNLEHNSTRSQQQANKKPLINVSCPHPPPVSEAPATGRWPIGREAQRLLPRFPGILMPSIGPCKAVHGSPSSPIRFCSHQSSHSWSLSPYCMAMTKGSDSHLSSSSATSLLSAFAIHHPQSTITKPTPDSLSFFLPSQLLVPSPPLPSSPLFAALTVRAARVSPPLCPSV